MTQEKELPVLFVSTGEGKMLTFTSPESFAQYLVSQGGNMVESVMKAQQTFDDLNAQAAGAKTEAPTEAPAEGTETPVAGTEAPVEPAKEEAKTEAKEESKMKKWFKNAAEKMSLSSKEQMLTHLWMEKRNAKTEEEKEEIQAFMDKLENEAGLYKEKVEPVVATVKGWAVDGSGKVADTLYLVGDYAGKGATGLTKVTGDVIVKTGEVISKTGELLKDNADNVGKVIEAPFKITGDAINVLNGTKNTGDDKKETEAPEATPEADKK